MMLISHRRAVADLWVCCPRPALWGYPWTLHVPCSMVLLNPSYSAIARLP